MALDFCGYIYALNEQNYASLASMDTPPKAGE
jgi:hypothetical protein